MTQKSALREALRTLNPKKEKPTINVCRCGTPLIFTFAFAYNEWFCLNCGMPQEFLGREEKEAIPELLAKQKVIDDIWEAIYKYFIPTSDYAKDKCKKCQKIGGYPHRQHLTEQEKLRDEVARRMLKQSRQLGRCLDATCETLRQARE